MEKHAAQSNFIDRETLQQLQDRFCEANHVYCRCFDRDDAITDRYGHVHHHAFFADYAPADVCQELVLRVLLSKVENVIEFDEGTIPDFVRIMSVGLRLGNVAYAAWIAIGIIEDKIPAGVSVPEGILLTNEQDFYKSVQLLETLSKQYMKSKDDENYLKEAMKQSIIDTEDAFEKYRRSTSMSRIISLLDSESSYSDITNDILKEVGEYAKLTKAKLLRLNPDGKTVENIGEWCAEKNIDDSGVGRTYAITELPFFTGKPYTISYGALLPADFKRFFDENGIRAAAFLPVNIGRENAMYLSFEDGKAECSFSMDEIKFFNEAKRILQNITLKRITKNSLTSSYVALEGVLENVGCGIRVVDEKTRKTLFTNRTYDDMFLGKTLTKEFEESFFSEEPLKSIREYRLEKGCYQAQQTEISWVDGRNVRLVTIYDITALRDYQEAIEREATRDFLTGMKNRRTMESELEKMLDSAVTEGSEGALFYIDIDDFKQINEALGHSYGDELLKNVAENLNKIRATREFAYNLGGDEFALILSPQYFKMFEDVVLQIKNVFEQSWMLGDNEYFCTASIGVVKFPRDGKSVSKLLQRADLALFDAKLRGKNRMEFYTDSTEYSSLKRIDVEHALKRAVRDGCEQFEVYFQPINHYDGRDIKCCGAEALVRWNSDKLGFVAPDEFIGMAEYLRLIIPIGEHVLRKACEKCKFWNDMGHPDYKVNVNLSVIQLLQNDIFETIENIINETGINPRNLTFEVTESLAINDIRRMKSVLSSIKKLGCRVALDDFGTGYSSLNHIRELPIDVIKIDRCFVQDIGRDEFSDSFVKMVGELANTIGMNVCAEGVETEMQLEMMKKMHVNLIQGYYFDKPMQGSDFDAKYVF